MPKYKYRRVDEIEINVPTEAEAQAELDRQGLVGYSLVKPAVVKTGSTDKFTCKVKTAPVVAVPVTVELICETKTIPEMKAMLEDAGIKFAKNSKEKTLANKILKAGIYK